MSAYNLSSSWVIKSFQQLHCCALSTTRLANQGDCLTFIDTEVETVKNVNTTACRVREMNVCEVYLAIARLLS